MMRYLVWRLDSLQSNQNVFHQWMSGFPSVDSPTAAFKHDSRRANRGHWNTDQSGYFSMPPKLIITGGPNEQETSSGVYANYDICFCNILTYSLIYCLLTRIPITAVPMAIRLNVPRDDGWYCPKYRILRGGVTFIYSSLPWPGCVDSRVLITFELWVLGLASSI